MASYKPGKNKRELTKMAFFVRRYLIYLVVLVVLIVGIIATMKIYNGTSEKEVNIEGMTTRLASADSYNLAMYEPSSFNVLSSNDEDVVYLNQIIFSSLFKLDETLNIVPDLVDSYSIDADRKNVRISLRQDACFSNGMTVTSNDIEKTVGWIKEIGSESPYFQYVKRIEKIESLGDKELIVSFQNSDASALDNLVFPIVSAAQFKKGERFSVGSGPYQYSTYDRGKELGLVPNEYYHRDGTNLPIHVMFIKDKNTIPGMITMDAVTAYLTKEQNADTVAEDKSLNCIPIVSSELEYMGFNCKNPLLAESSMRRAIAMAIDREKTIREDYGGDAVISDSIYFPGFLGVDSEYGIKYEPKSSTELITGMGLRDIDEDGILEDENGKDVSFRLIVNKSNGSRRDAAHSVSSDLISLGIGIEIIELDEKEFNSALESGNFDLYMVGMKVDKQFNLMNLYNENNYGRYEGEGVIELTKEMEKAYSNEEQKLVFSELKSQLYDDMPYFGICYKTYFFVSASTLELVDKPQFFNPYRKIETWSWQRRMPIEQIKTA